MTRARGGRKNRPFTRQSVAGTQSGRYHRAMRRYLIAYSVPSTLIQTTLDYLQSFRKFLNGEVHYLNVVHDAILDHVDLSHYDVVIQSYCARLIFDNYVSPAFIEKLKQFGGLKVIAVQDEYNRAGLMKRLVNEIGYDVFLSVVPEPYLPVVYPPAELPGVCFESVLTGYVPDYLVQTPRTIIPLKERPIVLGYRGRDIGGLYGRLGFEKAEIGRRMREVCIARGISQDIATDDSSRIHGEAWFDFIGACRAMLGSESGSNVFDFDGSLERRNQEMTAELGRPPTYQEFLPYTAPKESEVAMGQVSPRVFECAVMRTPMVMFRGYYSGAVEPDEHYIPLEKNFSNIDDVLNRLTHLDELEAIANRAFDHLVGSGRFGYSAFIKRIERSSSRKRSKNAKRRQA